jgi:hypothetical protein
MAITWLAPLRGFCLDFGTRGKAGAANTKTILRVETYLHIAAEQTCRLITRDSGAVVPFYYIVNTGRLKAVHTAAFADALPFGVRLKVRRSHPQFLMSGLLTTANENVVLFLLIGQE